MRQSATAQRLRRPVTTGCVALWLAALLGLPAPAQTQPKPQLGPPVPAGADAGAPPAPTDPLAATPSQTPPAGQAAGAPAKQAATLRQNQVELGARTVQQDDQRRTVRATGDLRFRWRDLKVSGDEALVNYRLNTARIIGPVSALRDDGTTFETDQLDIDLRKYWYTTGPFRAKIMPAAIGPDVVEPIYLSGGDTFSVRDTYFSAHRSILSSCPPNDLKYHIQARTIAVIPDRKIIFRSAKVYVFGVPIFAVGKLVLPLRRYRRAEWLPEFGRNDVYGFFTRMRYFYDLADSQFGNVSGMMTEKRGFFTGLEHDYGWARAEWRGQGRISAEFGSKQNDTTLRGDLSQRMGRQTDLKGNFSYSRNTGFSTSTSQSNLTGTLTHQFGLGTTTIGLSRSDTTSAGTSSNYTRLTFGQRLAVGDVFNADLGADYARRASTGSTSDAQLQTHAKLSGRWTLFDWEVLDQRQFDLNGDRQSTFLQTTTEIVPQLSLRTDSRRLRMPLPDVFNLRFDTNLGQYRETVTNPYTQQSGLSTVLRANFDLNGDVGRLSLGRRVRFLTNFRYSQSFFDHPDPAAKYIVAIGPTMEWAPIRHLRFDMRYRWQEVAGYSPLSRFDFAQSINDLDFTMSWFVPHPARPDDGLMALTLNGGYDMLTGYNRDLRIGAQIKPFRSLFLDLSTSYSLEGRGYSDAGFRALRGEVRMVPGRWWSHNVGFNYDIRNARLQNVDSLATLRPIRRLTIQNALTWDGYSKRVTFNDLLVDFNMGCVSLVGSYRQQSKEFRVDLNIAAFPGLATLFGTGKFGQQFSTSQGLQF